MKKTMLMICATLVLCVLALSLSKNMSASANGGTSAIPSATPPTHRQWEYTYDLTGYEYFNRGVSDGDVLTKMKQHGVEGWELAAIVPEMHEDKQGHRQYTATLIYKRPK
jgi:hypothetical protein